MSKKRPALGRGLGALIPEKPKLGATVKPEARRDGTPRELPIESITPNPDQPRKRFDRALLEALAESIGAQGIIQPIVVTPAPGGRGHYQIVAGERRWRAAQLAGLHQVPVFIRDTPEARRLELALVENLQRADLDPIEEALAYEQLMELHDYTQEQLAARVGKERSTVANVLRLLKLAEKVRELVAEQRLSMGHARALLAIETPSDQLRIAHDVIRRGLSVRATEAEVRRATRPEQPTQPDDDETKRHKTIVSDLETRLQRHLGARARLQIGGKRRKGPGKIEIPYADLEDLNRILHILLGTSE